MDQLPTKVGVAVEQNLRRALEIFKKIPGSSYIAQYIRKSHQNDPARTLFEFLLFLFALRYFLASKQSYFKRDYLKLSENEVEELIEEWEPKPLISSLSDADKMLLKEVPVVESASNEKVVIQGSETPELLNLTATDFFSRRNDKEITELAVEKIKYYGVGSCGPAGFYGNEDVHIRCEESLANFLGTQKCILYSQGYSTAPSVIPCFAKRGDVLFVDDAVCMPIQRGIELSRSKVYYFAHNDMKNLEDNLIKANSLYKGRGRIPRKFIITEGLFEYTGNSPDLVKIIELKKKYKARLILDESWSLGVLGRTGRGLAEECGISRSEIDATIGSLATGLGLYGGFCAGSSALVEHQRIISLAYTYSATEPPYLAGCTSYVVDRMAKGVYSQELHDLREKAHHLYTELNKCTEIDLISRPDSPLVIFTLRSNETADDSSASKAVHNVVMTARKNGLLLTRLGQVSQWENFGSLNAVQILLPNSLSVEKVKETAKKIIACVQEAQATN